MFDTVPGLVRFASLVAVVVAAFPAWGADARVTLLARQLVSTKDPRVRAQTVLLLGQTQTEEAVAPLCRALKDHEVVVRSAAANALGEFSFDDATRCLRESLNDPDATVRAAIQKALVPASSGAGGLYFSLEPIADSGGTLDSSLLALATSLLKRQLSELGATFAPPNEEKRAAQAIIRAKSLRGYQVRMQLSSGSTEKQLKVEMLIMTYPERSLQGTWNVKASGGKPESLIKAMVPKVVSDAAGDLNWRRQ